MKQYLDLLNHILANGNLKNDRTGTGTMSVFGYQMRFDLGDGFPLLTTKKLHIRSIVHELIWFLRGDTNVKYLHDNKVTIWDEWADENGDLGKIYGKQWRSWTTDNGYQIDQIKQVCESLKMNPDSRRHIVCSWNVGDLDEMALPPCHCLFQFYLVHNRLSCHLYQRSADVFLGVPFNIASYALLTHIIAKHIGSGVGDFIWTGGDVHLYTNHIEQARLQLTRAPYRLPTLIITKDRREVWEHEFDDFMILGYQAHPHIKAKVAV